MKDTYKYDSVGADSIIKTLNQTRARYEEQIDALANLARLIDLSSAWKDKKVKIEFMKTYNSYLSIYKDISNTMERYEKYLEKKSKDASQIERKYTR